MIVGYQAENLMVKTASRFFVNKPQDFVFDVLTSFTRNCIVMAHLKRDLNL